jgi:outer membrane protein TolC
MISQSIGLFLSLLVSIPTLLLVPALVGQTQQPIHLSLQESITLALKHNFDVRAARYTPQIHAANALSAKGPLAPAATFDFSTKDSRLPSPTPFLEGVEEAPEVLSLSTSNKQEWKLGFQDSLSTGTAYGLFFSNLRQKSNSQFQIFDPTYSSALSLVVTQPLLDGFGTGANQGRIFIARNTQQISIHQFQQQVSAIVSQVQMTYWALVYAIENLNVKELTLQHARDLLNFNKGRFRVGAATENDILQAEAAMASREAEVISVQDDVEDTTDQLKRLTNLMADDNAWSLQIAPTDTPDFKDVTVNLDESLKTALTNRPDYIGARIDLENKQIQVRLAKNQTLPTLDLEGTFSLNGLGGSYSDTLDELRSGDFRTWQIGVFLRFPIGDPTAKGELQKRRLENEQALTNFKSLEQRIVIEVREAVRQLKTNHKRIVATQSALELEERKLAAEQKKYELGLSTNYNVLQFQADLSEAQTRHLKAIIDYNKAQVILTETLGTTLLAHNIQLTE